MTRLEQLELKCRILSSRLARAEADCGRDLDIEPGRPLSRLLSKEAQVCDGTYGWTLQQLLERAVNTPGTIVPLDEPERIFLRSFFDDFHYRAIHYPRAAS